MRAPQTSTGLRRASRARRQRGATGSLTDDRGKLFKTPNRCGLEAARMDREDGTSNSQITNAHSRSDGQDLVQDLVAIAKMVMEGQRLAICKPQAAKAGSRFPNLLSRPATWGSMR